MKCTAREIKREKNASQKWSNFITFLFKRTFPENVKKVLKVRENKEMPFIYSIHTKKLQGPSKKF